MAYEKIPLSLSSFYIGNPKICKHKKNTNKKNGTCQHKSWQKNNKKTQQNKKYKNKNKMCRGGGDLLYLLCLISNTLPQLEQSSLQEQSSLHPSTVLHHRHLHTTSDNHLLLLQHLLSSRKEKTKQQQTRNPP